LLLRGWDCRSAAGTAKIQFELFLQAMPAECRVSKAMGSERC